MSEPENGKVCCEMKSSGHDMTFLHTYLPAHGLHKSEPESSSAQIGKLIFRPHSLLKKTSLLYNMAKRLWRSQVDTIIFQINSNCSKIIQTFDIVLVCPQELDGKTLLLKIQYIFFFATEHREFKMVLSRNLRPYWLFSSTSWCCIGS